MAYRVPSDGLGDHLLKRERAPWREDTERRHIADGTHVHLPLALPDKLSLLLLLYYSSA